MDISLFWRGLVMGVAIAAPVGPIGVLCIRQTLNHGLLTGLASGLGAATADGIYGSIAGFGLSAISDLLVTQKLLLKTIGGLFLCYLGVKTFLTATQTQIEPNNTGDHRSVAPLTSRRPLLQAYGATLALTLTNPTTILLFTALFAGLGIVNQGDNTAGTALMIVSGVFCGSALWWLTLSSGIAYFRRRFSLKVMGWVNRLSGIIISAFGVVAFFS